jgi:hypothetical protein
MFLLLPVTNKAIAALADEQAYKGWSVLSHGCGELGVVRETASRFFICTDNYYPGDGL